MKTDIVKESLRRPTGRKMTRIIRKPWVLYGFVWFCTCSIPSYQGL